MPAEQADHDPAAQQGRQLRRPDAGRLHRRGEAGDWTGAQNFAVNLIDTAGADAWPIVSATFILLPKDPKDPARSANVMKFFDWAYKNGGDIAKSLEYIAAAAAVQDAVRASWRAEIKGAGRRRRSGKRSDARLRGGRRRRLPFASRHATGTISVSDAAHLPPRSPPPAPAPPPFGDRLFAGAGAGRRRVGAGAARRHHRLAVHRRAARLPRLRRCSFLVDTDWDPVQEVFGAGGADLRHAGHLGAGAADGGAAGLRHRLLSDRIAPDWFRRPVGTAIELLAAVPSIIYGMWGFFVIVPIMARLRRAVPDRLRSATSRCSATCSRARRSAPASSPPR